MATPGTTGSDAQALVDLGDRLYWDDPEGARATFQQAIDSGHAEWAGAAMVGLAGLLQRKLDDDDAAQALYRQAIRAGNADWSGHASFTLGNLLAGRGDAAGAKAAWQPVIDAANPDWAGPAFTHLVNLLREHDDIEGLRAAYRNAAARGNPAALYALDVLGQQLDARGDTEGAHAAWQQAIDAGYERAGDLRERMSPAEPEEEPAQEVYPSSLPARFDPGNVLRSGVDVLEHGLPALPETLAYQMAIPVVYWTAGQCAVVLVLRFSKHGHEKPYPVAMQVTYSRGAAGWEPHSHAAGTGFSHDPVATPGDKRDLDGRAMVANGTSEADQVTPGHPAFIATGRAAPEVKHLAVTQDGREDRRRLDSHFGAWVVCTEQPGPFEVTGIDENGTVLASLRYP